MYLLENVWSRASRGIFQPRTACARGLVKENGEEGGEEYNLGTGVTMPLESSTGKFDIHEVFYS